MAWQSRGVSDLEALGFDGVGLDWVFLGKHLELRLGLGEAVFLDEVDFLLGWLYSIEEGKVF